MDHYLKLRPFPSLRRLMKFDISARSLLNDSTALPIDLPEFSGISNPHDLFLIIRRITELCWAGYWWLTQCRRILAGNDPSSSSPSPSPSCMLTPIESSHHAAPEVLNSLPIPPLLSKWAHEQIQSKVDSMPPLINQLAIPWCNDVSHLASSWAKANLTTTNGTDAISTKQLQQYNVCCARALLNVELLRFIDIPEAQVLEYSVQQCEKWSERTRLLLPAAAFRQAGLAVPIEAESRETSTLLSSVTDFDLTHFHHRQGHSITHLVGISYESVGLHVTSPEVFLIISHLHRVHIWQQVAASELVSVLRLFQSASVPSKSLHAKISAGMKTIENLLRQSNRMNIWTQESHALLRAWHQGKMAAQITSGKAAHTKQHRSDAQFQQQAQTSPWPTLQQQQQQQNYLLASALASAQTWGNNSQHSSLRHHNNLNLVLMHHHLQ